MSQSTVDTDNVDREGVRYYGPLAAVVLTIFIFLSSQILAVLAMSIVLKVVGLEDDAARWMSESKEGVFALYLAVSVISMKLLGTVMRKRNIKWADIGFHNWKVGYIGRVILSYIGYLMVLILTINIFKSLVPSFNTERAQQLGFDMSGGGAALVPVFISLVVLPPIVEESLMRGFLFTNLRRRRSLFYSTVVVSVVFASAHLQIGSGAPLLWSAALDTFILSVFMCRLREETGSLWPCIMLHALKNLVAFWYLFVLKV